MTLEPVKLYSPSFTNIFIGTPEVDKIISPNNDNAVVGNAGIQVYHCEDD